MSTCSALGLFLVLVLGYLCLICCNAIRDVGAPYMYVLFVFLVRSTAAGHQCPCSVLAAVYRTLKNAPSKRQQAELTMHFSVLSSRTYPPLCVVSGPKVWQVRVICPRRYTFSRDRHPSIDVPAAARDTCMYMRATNIKRAACPGFVVDNLPRHDVARAFLGDQMTMMTKAEPLVTTKFCVFHLCRTTMTMMAAHWC